MESKICLLLVVFFTCFCYSCAIGARLKDFPNSQNVQLWTCNKALIGQQWEYHSSDKTIRLHTQQSKCLDVSGYSTDDGANIWLFDCHTDQKDPSQQNQEWIMNSNGTIIGTMSKKCIEAASGNEMGANIQINTCNGGDNQVWSYSSTDYTLSLKSAPGYCVDVGSSATCLDSPWNTLPYCDITLDLETRVKDLLSRLSLSDKVSLMQNDHSGVSRLAVPPFGHTECTHGTLNDGKILTTLFPQAISFARSFNRKLVYSIARAISDEVRAKHNTANAIGESNYPFGIICWAPVVNVCRDPRWGRCQEGYGEDPFLQGELGKQYVTALQNSPNSTYIEAVATCKHFDVHTGPENIPANRGSFDSVVAYRDWIETFQPAFKACNEAGVISYMCSYNAINGVPSCANHELLTEITRNTWGFDGFVVSDCGAVRNVFTRHQYARSDQEAAVFCAKAGCDWNCGGEFGHLYDAVNNGLIAEQQINISVSRLLKAMFQLGEFDPPEKVNYHYLDMSVVDKHIPLNREAAQQSIVLLKNKDKFLPIDPSKYKSVAIIGPCADDADCAKGDYDPAPKYVTTVKAAFTSSTKLSVNYVQGCSDVKCANDSKFSDAVNAAKSSDMVVYVGGINKGMEGEGNDRSSIILPGHQPDLIKMLKAAGKPMIVVLYHGAPLATPVFDTDVDVMLSAGYTGQETGNAVLDIITGAYNPSGRLVVTWYTGDEQLPPMVSYSMVNRTYRYMQASPRYYFGYGLSYTTFDYSSLTIISTKFSPCQVVEGSVVIQNTGSVSGDEVAQIYISFLNATVPAPKIKLVDFDHISGLAPGSKSTVRFSISPEQLTVVHDGDFIQVIEPGMYNVYAGGHQPDDTNAPGTVLKVTFTITGDTTPLSKC